MTKKVLFFHEEFPSGGTERVTIDIADYLSIYGYEVYVLACKIKRIDFAHVTVVPMPGTIDVNNLAAAEYIVEVLNSLSIDIFVLPVRPSYGHLEYIKSHTNCKLVFALHSVPLWEVICGLYNKKKRCEGSLVKSILWHLVVYPKTKWIKKYDKNIVDVHRKVYDVVDRYTVLCEGYKRFILRKMGLSLENSKVCVIHNSEVIPSFVNLHKKKQIIFVGRMNYEDKRIDRLIDIWSMIHKKAIDWEVILVGDGSERAALQLRVEKNKLERIRFVGHSNSVSDYYQDAAVLCLTSTFEGWPLCLTEAQAHGVVPIAFDCTAGVHEILSPSGVNGILIPPFNKKMYANSLLSLLNDSSRLYEMRQNVLAKSKQYSTEIVGKKWLDLFDSLLKEAAYSVAK